MKPIIIITGVPHSYTSMISKFLIDNGAFVKEIWGGPTEKLKYERHEELATHNYALLRKKFKKADLSLYFKSLPEDRVCVAKEPGIAYFLNELKQYTNRKIKIVYVLRNPEQIILSSMEKSQKSFIYYFQKIIWQYDFAQDCDLEVLPFMSERINKDAERLLNFSELYPKTIDYRSICEMKPRKPSYLNYRFANFFWKRLSRFFKVF